MVNYKNSVIYKICCNDTEIKDIYIGSTTNFIMRKHKHKSVCNDPNNKQSYEYKYCFIRENGGWNNWNMIEIKSVECNNKRELEKYEREVYEEYKPTLNKYRPIILKEKKRLIVNSFNRKYYHQKKKQEIN